MEFSGRKKTAKFGSLSFAFQLMSYSHDTGAVLSDFIYYENPLNLMMLQFRCEHLRLESMLMAERFKPYMV